MNALDPETERNRWRRALAVPSVIVGGGPFLVILVGLYSRWIGYGRFEQLVHAAKYANGVCTGLLVIGAALILSYTPAHKKVAVSALVLAAIGLVFHFGLYSID